MNRTTKVEIEMTFTFEPGEWVTPQGWSITSLTVTLWGDESREKVWQASSWKNLRGVKAKANGDWSKQVQWPGFSIGWADMPREVQDAIYEACADIPRVPGSPVALMTSMR